MQHPPGYPQPPQQQPPPGYPPPQYPPPVPYGYGYPAYPPAPPWLRVPTAPGERPPEMPYRLAGWWARVGAQLIDLLIVWAPSAVVIIVLAVLADDAHGGTRTALLVVLAVLSLLVYAVHLFYAPLLMKRRGARNGQTWGKQLASIRVIRADGDPMSFSDAAMRQIVFKSFGVIVASTFVPLYPFILNYLWPTWDEQHRALHDHAAKTRVVRA
jgi:uncharacterized RDD family membrane protein YckC